MYVVLRFVYPVRSLSTPAKGKDSQPIIEYVLLNSNSIKREQNVYPPFNRQTSTDEL